ncbi:MAG: glycosyltransferase [Ruminococcus sp.]|nr:glycosyltransferase [Ruminococcus sp.]MBQ8296933.1 glycosyltransferase [Ruminococcus sp.]
MSEKVRVLESVNSLGLGGNVIFVMNFFRKIDKEKFQVDFVIYDDSKMDYYDEVKKAGSRVFVIKKKYGNKLLQLFSQMNQVRKLLKKEKYDVIHCHSCSFIGLFRGVVPGHFSKGIKVISHGHNPGRPKNTKLDNIVRGIFKSILSKCADMGFACSDESGASKYTSKFMNSGKYSVINNAIETEKFRYSPANREEIRAKYNLGDKFVIGSIGRLEEQKNYLYMIDVLAEYVKINKNACLFLVGDGSQREQIVNKAKEKGIENHLVMAGRTDTPEIFYSAMDVFVLPSIFEGFGFVNIEAQVSGLPCVVSTAVPREINISDRVYFIDFNVDEWCTALEKVRKSVESSERKSIGTEKYDINNECRRLEAFYSTLAGVKER